MRMPSDAEISAVGEKLGHGPGPYATKLRAQLAKTIQLADAMAKEQVVNTTSTKAFGDRVSEVYTDLRKTLSAEGAERVVAAIAPTIYRETRENGTPHNDRTT